MQKRSTHAKNQIYSVKLCIKLAPNHPVYSSSKNQARGTRRNNLKYNSYHDSEMHIHINILRSSALIWFELVTGKYGINVTTKQHFKMKQTYKYVR